MTASPQTSWLAPAPATVAVEIAARRVTVAELSSTSQGPVVSAYASEPLPADAVTPALAGPNIANREVVADALRRTLDRAGLRSARRVALVVPDSAARVSLLPFDQLPARPADLEQLIRWQLRKGTPFPIDEAQVSHFQVHAEAGSSVRAAVVARRDVIAQYEAVTAAAGLHAGIVDLASFNVMNAIIGAGAAAADDWLLVCLADEATTLAVLRGSSLMFYRHRTALDEEPLGALVHQTAMYHQDRLGGSRFARVWLCGAALTAGTGSAERARREISAQLGMSADAVDIRPAASLRDRAAGPEVLDALAALVGVLLRERKAA
jgi:type IV pilus assembly protein PilM